MSSSSNEPPGERPTQGEPAPELRESGAPAAFPSTCWSRVLGQPEDSRASQEPDLEALSRTYWRPVFGYIRTKWGVTQDEALDATQDFFVWMLETGLVDKADRQRGRFRAFLKAALRNFLIDRDRRRNSQKRGGSRVHLSLDFERDDAPTIELAAGPGSTPEAVLDTMWRTQLLERATASLEAELQLHGKAVYFAVFRDYYLQADENLDYKRVAERYDLTATNVSNYLMYTKKRYKVHLRAAVMETVRSPDDLEQELEWLFRGVRT